MIFISWRQFTRDSACSLLFAYLALFYSRPIHFYSRFIRSFHYAHHRRMADQIAVIISWNVNNLRPIWKAIAGTIKAAFKQGLYLFYIYTLYLKDFYNIYIQNRLLVLRRWKNRTYFYIECEEFAPTIYNVNLFSVISY